MDETKKKLVFTHDIFNILSIIIVGTVNIYYLTHTTDFSRFGTDQLGFEYVELFKIHMIMFSIYVLIDTLWIMMIPNCVMSDSFNIIIHHFICLGMNYIPYVHNQFAWHFEICVFVEFNTLFLTIRRNLSKGTILFSLFDGLFFFTWVTMRLMLFPVLVVFFVSEYIRFSKDYGSYINIVIFSPTLHAMITLMSFKWTYDMYKKLFSSKNKKEE